MFVEVINTIGTLSNAYEIGKKSQPLLGRIVRRLRDRKLNIVICGAAGTGKSTLGKLLSGSFGREDILRPYQISIRDEELKLNSKISSSIVVLPGQSTFWDEALRKIANNQVSLIINVVSAGYHSISQVDYQNFPSYQPGATAQEFIDVYRQEKQKLESNLLEKLMPHLSLAGNSKIVMMTLVTKQDLWWKSRHQIRDHYQLGTYNDSIQKLQNTLGKFNFVHEYISTSLVTENFTAVNGEILTPVAEGYDYKTQLANFDKVLQFIEGNFEIELER
jgi:energy-coupling factor transporter ATP-binding protein EcfA2